MANPFEGGGEVGDVEDTVLEEVAEVAGGDEVDGQA